MSAKSTGYFYGRNKGHGIVMQGFELHSSHVADTSTPEGMEAVVRAFKDRDELLAAVKHAQKYLRSKRFAAGMRDGVAFVLESAIAKVESK